MDFISKKINDVFKEPRKPFINSFKSNFSYDARKKEADKLRKKYPDKYPVVCDTDKTAPKLDKNKYLVSGDITIGQFLYVVRKRIELTPEYALYFYINGRLLPPSQLVSQVYNEMHEDDGFLYIQIFGESTFG
jgi:GABA(A) receptor-associated protein